MENKIGQLGEVLKAMGRKAYYLLLAVILAACGTKPSEIKGVDFLDCNNEERDSMSVDLPPGSEMNVEGATILVKDGDGNVNVKGESDVANDGTITVHQKGQDLLLKGSPGKGNKSHIEIEGVCQKPAPPTPTPRTSSFRQNGFPSAKPVQVFRRTNQRIN